MINRLSKVTRTISVLALFVISSKALGSTIRSCEGKTNRCVAELKQGLVGDLVVIMDTKGRPIARGKIVKKQGLFGSVEINPLSGKEVYPGALVKVELDSTSSSLPLASSLGFSE
jgi:hypothetical protein